MLYSEAILFGMIQGISEFLPISSSAHLIIAQGEIVLGNILILHLSTMLVIIIFFFKDIKKLFLGFLDILTNKKSDNMKSTLLLIISFLPFAIIGFLCDIFFNIPKTNTIIGISSIIFGALLYISDYYPIKFSGTVSSFKDALLIGLSEIISIIPGSSRLGITTSCMRFLGYSRSEAIKFSLIISIPIILLGNAWYIIKYFVLSTTIIQFDINLIFSCISAILFGFITISFITKHTSHAMFTIFAIYKIIFGIMVLLK